MFVLKWLGICKITNVITKYFIDSSMFVNCFCFSPDRSGVNKFVKEFEESREKLDLYCNTLSRSINDKRSLIDMLYHSETYYDAAYEEAKVIVHVSRFHRLTTFIHVPIFPSDKFVNKICFKAHH